MRNPSLRRLCLPLAVLATMSLSACAASSKNAAAPQKATGATPPAGSSAPSPGPALLTRAEFVAKMNAVCADFVTKLQDLPRPTAENDYTTMAAAADGTLKLFPQYVDQAEALVSRSADKATLTEHWLTVEKSDYAAVEPLLKRFIADVKAHDLARMAGDSSALDDAPDHSEAIAGFMSGYGLKSCADLQSS